MFKITSFPKKINIGRYTIHKNSKCLIVAELSGNHGGKLKNVFKAIDKIKKSGADAIKIQSYEPHTITLNAKNKYFWIKDKSIWSGQYLYDLYKRSYTPFSWHKKIFSYAKKKKLLCFSSPFDKSSVDLLESCNCPCYKIASPEITDLELIDYVSRRKKPMIISTGIANQKDIDLAVNQCLKNNNNKLIILHCISSYPAQENELNLNYLNILKKRFPIYGYSDHSIGEMASLVALSLGSKVIEKHFKINDKIKSADNTFSTDVKKFEKFILNVRRLETILGTDNPNKKKILKNKLTTVSRSLFYVKDLKKGDILKRNFIKSVRPGVGLNPQYLSKILGKKIKANVKKNTPTKKDHF